MSGRLVRLACALALAFALVCAPGAWAIEGDEGQEHLDEYADATTERGACMLKTICEEMGFDSLSYQSLPGMLEAIGIDPSTVCTYCWDGRE